MRFNIVYSKLQYSSVIRNAYSRTVSTRKKAAVSDSLVTFHVQRQMIGSREAAETELAIERSIARMFSEVSGQFVGSGEFPVTAFPSALVRFLACVSSHMSLQMGTFRIDFVARGIRTSVHTFSFPYNQRVLVHLRTTSAQNTTRR